MKRDKYNSRRGVGIDSALEGSVGGVLKQLEAAGFVSSLKKMIKQVDSITLSDTFTIKSSATKTGTSKIRHISYTPDFYFQARRDIDLPCGINIRKGSKCYVEVKSKATKVIRDYFMRKHLMLRYCVANGLVFIEIVDNIKWTAFNH